MKYLWLGVNAALQKSGARGRKGSKLMALGNVSSSFPKPSLLQE